MENHLKKIFFPSWEQNTFNVSGEKLTQFNLFQILSMTLNLTQNVPKEKRTKGKTLEGRHVGPACEGEPGCSVCHWRPYRDLNLGRSSVSLKLSGWCEHSIDNWRRNCPLRMKTRELSFSEVVSVSTLPWESVSMPKGQEFPLHSTSRLSVWVAAHIFWQQETFLWPCTHELERLWASHKRKTQSRTLKAIPWQSQSYNWV